MKQKYQNQQPTVLETILVGIAKALWWLIKYPFTKGKKGGCGITTADRNHIASKRQEIETMLRSENIHELKQALFEADKMVDHILKLKGYAGETFADRLRSAESYIDRNLYNEIWQGHKVRNQLAHEQGVGVRNNELRDAAGKLLKYAKMV
ncbi:MAG TPA: hypothetical protein PK263_00815 [bacterium]|nr:hypothetical protein [bacterium]